MNRIPLPPSDIAWKGAPIAFENAKRHLRCAEKLSEMEEWGVASSHLVLAAEEAVKASMLALYGAGFLPVIESFAKALGPLASWLVSMPKKPEKYLEDLLNLHSARHDAATGIVMFFWMIPHYDNASGKTLRDLTLHIIPKILRGPEGKELRRTLIWLKNANALKSGGFYTDPLKGEWHSPDEITQRDYDASLQSVNSLISNLEQIGRRWQESGGDRDKFSRELQEEMPKLSSLLQEETAGMAESIGSLLRDVGEEKLEKG